MVTFTGADARVSLLFDPKDGRWRVLVEFPDGSARASEDRTLSKALAWAGDVVLERTTS